MWRLFLLLIALLCLVATPASAQEDPPPVDVEISTGFGGLFVPGRPVPVRIGLQAPSLTSGQLTLSMQMGPAELLDFEVAGGGSEEHWVLLDSPIHDEVIEVRASLEVDGRRRDVGRGAGSARWDPDIQLVGVVEGSALAAQPPRDVRTAVLDQELAFAVLAPPLLDLGQHALSALDAVALTEADLAALPAEHRSSLLGWVRTGGTLYVDVPAGDTAGLPGGLELAAGGTGIGTGRMVGTDGALAAGAWADVVVPAPNRSILEDRDVQANLPHPDLGSEIFSVDLGRDLPPLGRLLAIIGIYSLLVGPVLYLALRRRPMLRWAAIPALAVLTTGVLYLSGDGVGSGTTVDVVDVIETGPTGALATTRVIMATDQSGRDLLTPVGWTAEQDDLFGFQPQDRVTQRRTVDGVRMSMPAAAGGVGLLRASGPVELDGALEVEAFATAEGTIRGTVRNTTDASLEEVAVFVGRAASSPLGSLAAGESTDFEVTGTTQFRFGTDLFWELWSSLASDVEGEAVTTTFEVPPPPPDMGPIVMEECDQFGNCTQCDDMGNCFGFGGDPGFAGPGFGDVHCDEMGNCFPVGGCGQPGFCGALARPASLTAALWDRGSNALPNGLVTVVGWTTDLDPVVDLGRDVDVVGIRTALVGRAVPSVDADVLVDSGTVRSLVRVGNSGDGFIEIVNRYDLPTVVSGRPVDPSRLRLDLPGMFTEVAVLTPGGEVLVRSNPDGGRDRQEVAVPPEAVVRGHVFIRTVLPFEPPAPGRELVIYEAGAS